MRRIYTPPHGQCFGRVFDSCKRGIRTHAYDYYNSNEYLNIEKDKLKRKLNKTVEDRTALCHWRYLKFVA